MLRIKSVLALSLLVASMAAATAQSAKPADPTSWADGAVTAAQTPPRGAGDTVTSALGAQGFANARHAAGEEDSHPAPPSGVSVPNRPGGF